MKLYSSTNKIVISQSESVRLKLRVYEGNNLYQPTESDKFILTVKTADSKNAKSVISLSAFGSSNDSFVAFDIGSALTSTLTPGRYYYDIWLENENLFLPLTDICVFDCKASLIERGEA